MFEKVPAGRILYHCASSSKTEKILSDGFKAPVDFLAYYDTLISMLPPEEADDLRGRYPDDTRRGKVMLASAVRDRWNARYGKGTLIWLSEDAPDDTYGSSCLVFTTPPGLVRVVDAGDELYYFPRKIPSKYFKVYELKESVHAILDRLAQLLC